MSFSCHSQGYPPIYFDVTITGKYYTIDFVAKAAQTEISFKNWGHISLLVSSIVMLP